MNSGSTTMANAAARPGMRRASGTDVDHVARLFAAAFMRDPVFDWMVKTGTGRLRGAGVVFSLGPEVPNHRAG